MKRVQMTLISLTLVLSACAGTYDRASVDEELTDMGLQRSMEDDASIPRYRINGWRFIDDENIVVTAGVNDRYLVELQPGCFDIESAFTLAFRTSTNRLDRFGRIVYRSSISGVQTCRIRNIYPLERFYF